MVSDMIEFITGQILKNASRVCQRVTHLLGGTIEFTVVDAHSYFIFLGFRDDGRSERSEETGSQFLLDKIIYCSSQSFFVLWGQATGMAVILFGCYFSELNFKRRDFDKFRRKSRSEGWISKVARVHGKGALGGRQ